jgi:hypothetical protein
MTQKCKLCNWESIGHGISPMLSYKTHLKEKHPLDFQLINRKYKALEDAVKRYNIPYWWHW